MAIKILSYNSSPNVKYVTTCTCGCKFTFNETDTWIDKSPNPISGPLSGHCVECPNCKAPVYGSLWYVLDPLTDKYDDDNDYRNELNDLKSKIKLHRLVKLAEEYKDTQLKQMALKILKEKYGENEESI